LGSGREKAVNAYLKANCGLEGTSPGNTMCHFDMKDLLYPNIFRGCDKEPCEYRHGRTANAAGGAYLDGSESQKDVIRALTPSFTTAIANGTIKKYKIPKKKGK
jgi:hypothetical protein